MERLAVNQLLRFADDRHIERVLWLDADQPGYVVIDIAAKSALLLFRSHSELEALSATGQITFDVDDPFAPPVNEGAIPTSYREIRDRNWDEIAPLVLQQPRIFDRRHRGKIIAALTAEQGRSHVGLYRLLRRLGQRQRPHASGDAGFGFSSDWLKLRR